LEDEARAALIREMRVASSCKDDRETREPEIKGPDRDYSGSALSSRNNSDVSSSVFDHRDAICIEKRAERYADAVSVFDRSADRLIRKMNDPSTELRDYKAPPPHRYVSLTLPGQETPLRRQVIFDVHPVICRGIACDNADETRDDSESCLAAGSRAARGSLRLIKAHE